MLLAFNKLLKEQMDERIVALQAVEALCSEAKSSNFSMVEMAHFPWGRAQVRRLSSGSGSPSAFELFVQDENNEEIMTLPVSALVVASAIEDGISVIAAALVDHPKMMKKLAKHVGGKSWAAVERAELALSGVPVSNAKKAKKTL